MMNFKNRNINPGMTFIEVTLAVFIIGSLLSSLLLLQSNVVRNVFQFSSRSDRLFLMKDRLAQTVLEREQKKEGKKETKIENPQTTIIYEQKKVAKGSTLKNFEDIVIEQVTAKWDEWGSTQKETMITFLYKPESKKV